MDKNEIIQIKDENIQNEEQTIQNKTAFYTEIPSFNSLTEHYKNVMGVPTQAANFKSLPKLIRWFGYFFFAAFSVGVVIFVIAYILQ